MLVVSRDGFADTLIIHFDYPFRTLDTTVEFLEGRRFDYLMGKSNANPVYDPEQTYQHLVELADQDAWPENDQYDVWNTLARHLLSGPPADVSKPEERQRVKNELRIAVEEEQEAATIAYEVADSYASLVHDYPQFWRTYYNALQHWAKLIRDQRSAKTFFRDLRECAFL
jgi:hypothetical protein